MSEALPPLSSTASGRFSAPDLTRPQHGEHDAQEIVCRGDQGDPFPLRVALPDSLEVGADFLAAPDGLPARLGQEFPHGRRPLPRQMAWRFFPALWSWQGTRPK